MKKTSTSITVINTIMLIAAMFVVIGVILLAFVSINNSLAKRYKTFPNVFGYSYYPVLDSGFGEDIPYGSMILIEKDVTDGDYIVGLTPHRTIEIFTDESEIDITKYTSFGTVTYIIDGLGGIYEGMGRTTGMLFLILIPLEIALRLLNMRLKASSASVTEIEFADDDSHLEDSEPVKKPAKALNEPLESSPKDAVLTGTAAETAKKAEIVNENPNIKMKTVSSPFNYRKAAAPIEEETEELFQEGAFKAQDLPASLKAEDVKPLEEVKPLEPEYIDIPVIAAPVQPREEKSDVEFEIELPKFKKVPVIDEMPTMEYSLRDLADKIAERERAENARRLRRAENKAKQEQSAREKQWVMAEEAQRKIEEQKARENRNTQVVMVDNDDFSNLSELEIQLLKQLEGFDRENADLSTEFVSAADIKPAEEIAPPEPAKKSPPPLMTADQILEKYKKEFADGKGIKPSYVKVKAEESESEFEEKKLAELYYKTDMSEYD